MKKPAKVLVIYCHPSANSHNARILEHVTAGLQEAGTDFTVLDLYSEEFSACLEKAEYEALGNQDAAGLAPDVAKWQKAVSESTDLVFIYPVWWYGMPARLKGFMDRVLTQGFAFRFSHVPGAILKLATIISFVPILRRALQTHAAVGLLKGKRAWIFRSFGGPKFGKRVFGNVTAGLEDAVLRFCGITRIRVHELYNVNKSQYSQAYEDAYMAKARQIASLIPAAKTSRAI